MPEPIIELTNVTKSFRGNRVLAGVTLRVEPGQTYAFLGRNGAGKTTTIRMLMGLIRPDSGDIRVLGLDPRIPADALEIRRRVGYLAEDQQMWGWMTLAELLSFMAPFYPTWDMPFAKELLQKWELPAGLKIKHLSKGQNVRLGLLLALAHRPRLVILDDPALGLDPIMRKEFLRDVVGYLQGSDVTVFFSSHLLYEVEPVADIVGILDQGRIVREAGTEDLREDVQRLTIPAEAWDKFSSEIENVLDVRRSARQVAVIVPNAAQAAAALRKVGIAPELTGLNLDEIFEAYVIGQKPFPPSGAIGAKGAMLLPRE